MGNNNKNTRLVMFAVLGLVMATAILVLPTVPEQQAHAQHHGPPHHTNGEQQTIAKDTGFNVDVHHDYDVSIGPLVHLGHH